MDEETAGMLTSVLAMRSIPTIEKNGDCDVHAKHYDSALVQEFKTLKLHDRACLCMT